MARKSGNHVGLFLHEDELAIGKKHATYMNFVVFLVKGFPCKHNQARPVAVKNPLIRRTSEFFRVQLVLLQELIEISPVFSG
jgi:hypothetical protein